MSTEVDGIELAETQSAEIRARKAAVLQEAIEATGGAHGDLTASVKIYIDERHPDFPWGNNWSAEVDGARAALRNRTAKPRAGRPASARPDVDTATGADEIEAAKAFVQMIDGTSIERAREVLDCVARLGGVKRMRAAIDAWDDLLEAVGGDTRTVDRVLAVVRHRLLDSGFPRLAEKTTSADAA